MFTLLLTLFAVADPFRLRGRPGRSARGRSVVGLGVVGLAVVAAAPTVLGGLDISEPTARVAAGVAVVLSAAVELIDPRRFGTSVLRPAAVLVLLVGGVDPGRWTTIGALAGVIGLGSVVAAVSPVGESSGWTRTSRWVAVLAVLLGLDLVVDGIYLF